MTRGGSGEATTWAVLVAAGDGTRLQAGRPKAFVGLGERPLLAESLERLELSTWIDAIVVVAPPGWEEATILLAEEIAAAKVASVVAGGATRAESVRAGLAEVADEALVIVVHDAARPLVTDAVLERVLRGLGDGSDGVVPAVPVADTVKRVSGEVVLETVDRAALVAVQTPQAFAAGALRRAYAADLAGATDCASLVERAGGRVRTVAGDPQLHKITTRDDLTLVASWLAEE